MNEMIDISKLKTYSKPHKVYIPSKYGSFVKRADLERLLETAHNSDYAKCKCIGTKTYTDVAIICDTCGNVQK